jgi:outer membrane murein-binding lipoprotein Lpp
MDNVVASHNKNVGILEQKVKDMEEAASLAKSDANKAKVRSTNVTTFPPEHGLS